MDSIGTGPNIINVILSLSTWFLMFIGLIGVRAEIHEWVNVIVLAAVYPMYLWYQSKNNILGSISQESMIAIAIGTVLSLTAMLEGPGKKSAFSRNLKKNFKEYGKDVKGTVYASVALMASLLVGVVFSYSIRNDKFFKV